MTDPLFVLLLMTQVNLPARLVVLKNTTMYSMGKVEEYPEGQILQMIGRAGRPQFDDQGGLLIYIYIYRYCLNIALFISS